MARIKAVLFDLDGVLVDTLHYHYLAWEKMFSDRGGHVKELTVLLHEGRNSFEILPVLMKESGVHIPESEHEKFIHDKRAYYRSIVDVRFYPFALDVVDEVKKREIQAVIVTACSQLTMRKSLSKQHRQLFDFIQTGDDVPRAKPYPDPYDIARKKLQLNRDECLVIENAPLGIASANAAGIECIAISSTLPAKYLSEADVIIHSINDLMTLKYFNNRNTHA
ncbi:HAD family phosphatase [bacterium]|nr:HAD family phosphatase [bacterium]